MNFKLGIQRACYPPIEHSVLKPSIAMNNPPDEMTVSNIEKQVNALYRRYEAGTLDASDCYRLIDIMQLITAVLREKCSTEDLNTTVRMCAKISIMQGRE